MDRVRFIDQEKGIVYITVTGELTLKEIKDDLAQLAVDPSYRPEMPGLVDLRGVTKLLDPDGMVRLAEFIRASPRVVNRARRAFLVGSDHSYGMYRLFEYFVDGSGVEFNVFRDETEARAWVEEAAAQPN